MLWKCFSKIWSNTMPRRDSLLLASRTLTSVTWPTTSVSTGIITLPCEITSWLTSALILSPGFSFLAFKVLLNSTSRNEPLFCALVVAPGAEAAPDFMIAAEDGVGVETCAVGEVLPVAACWTGFSSAFIWSMPAMYALELYGHAVTITAAPTIQ